MCIASSPSLGTLTPQLGMGALAPDSCKMTHKGQKLGKYNGQRVERQEALPNQL